MTLHTLLWPRIWDGSSSMRLAHAAVANGERTKFRARGFIRVVIAFLPSAVFQTWSQRHKAHVCTHEQVHSRKNIPCIVMRRSYTQSSHPCRHSLAMHVMQKQTSTAMASFFGNSAQEKPHKAAICVQSGELSDTLFKLWLQTPLEAILPHICAIWLHLISNNLWQSSWTHVSLARISDRADTLVKQTGVAPLKMFSLTAKYP